MSDYESNNALPDLKEFLCVVPQDQKFILPATAHVLLKSIREKDDFSAYKAIRGFEAIGQLAKNLLQKFWCRELQVLKMYSGFLQSEVLGNLLDAEKLFEAMGYRRMSDEVFVLDGPICPDQVTHVSRDAMAASVECQIIMFIYNGLVALGLSCPWEEVLQYREKYPGGPTEATKCLAYAIHERRSREEKLKGSVSYAAVAGHVNYSVLTSSGGNCNMNADNMIGDHQQQQQQKQQQPSSMPVIRYTFSDPMNNSTLFAQNASSNTFDSYEPHKKLKARAMSSFNGSQRKKAVAHAHDSDSMDQSDNYSRVAPSSISFGDFVTVCRSKKTISIVGDKKSGNGKAHTKPRDAKLNTKRKATTRHSGAKQRPPVSTQALNEWSCRFCTFLNPDTKRICEMCCRSKDF